MPAPLIFDISSWELRDDEPQGKNEKSWYREPGDNRDWLFKPAARAPGQEPDGRNWAEKIAELLAVELEIPVAPVELAVLDGVAGTICLNVNPSGLPIQSGSALLTNQDLTFDPRARDSAGHNPTTIARALDGVHVPLTFDGPRSLTSYDVFCGYLVLDALIANQDRHSQNWSAVTMDGERHLMESYDHGSSFGAGMTDARREMMLTTDSAFQGFLRRGKASRFEEGHKRTLREFARFSLGTASPGVREHWLDRIIALQDRQIQAAVDQTPQMSVVSSTFVTKLVVAEREGLIDALG